MKLDGHPIIEEPSPSIRKSRNPPYKVGEFFQVSNKHFKCVCYIKAIHYSYRGYVYEFELINNEKHYWVLKTMPIKQFDNCKPIKLTLQETNELKAMMV